MPRPTLITPLLRRLLLFTLVLPVLAWFIVKPVRVALPGLNGVSCVAQICVDDPARLGQAQQLEREARDFIALRFGVPLVQPRLVFCSQAACAEQFGLGARSAVTVGTVGTVIGPKAWQPHYVRHELIHQLQAEQLGSVLLLLKPTWLIEGMAYALSDDPRPRLAEPWQAHRVRFLDWYGQGERAALWERARQVWVIAR